MSNGEVKRWQAPHMMRSRLPAERRSETDHATEAYATPCTVVLASDHDRIVANKDGELLTFYRMAANGIWIESKEYDEILKTIAAQKHAIEKLKTYAKHSVDCICRAGVLQYSDDCDCGLKAIEKGEA